jgi:glycosyltransferase involved in cell wall biosynthesis
MNGPAPIPLLHFTNSSARGGAEEHILTLLRRTDRRYFKLHLVVAPEVAELLRSDVPADVEMIPLRLRKPQQIGAARQLVGILRSRNIQILHSHLFYSSLFASPLGRVAGVPVICETPHVRELWRKGWKSSFAVDRFAGHFVDAWIAVSQANADYLVREKRVPAKKVHVVHNGCDIRRFSLGKVAPPEVRRSVGVGTNEIMAVVLARLEPQKGHRYLLEALPSVAKEFPLLRVVFVGDGQLRVALETQARSLGLEAVVRFAGYQSNAPEWLAASDFTVLPSLFEGLPLVAIESLAAGKPVIATAVDGSPEVVVQGQTGMLVPPEDPGALATALRAMLQKPQDWQRLGAAGRGRVEELFTEDLQVRHTEDLYLSVLQQKTGRAVVREELAPVAQDHTTAVNA